VAAIATSADGAYIFLALQNSAGFPVFVRASRDNLSVWTEVYSPGVGSSANVASVPGNSDLMIFYGYFGTGVQVISHTISTAAEVNISPTGLAAQVVNTLAVNPSDPNEMMLTVDTAQDLYHTLDGGALWTQIYTTLVFNATGLAVRWDDPNRVFVAGYDGADVDLLWTPNEGASVSDEAGAALGAALGVCSVELTLEAS
jgi:hypothetical protein